MSSLAPGVLVQQGPHGILPTRHGWEHTYLPRGMGAESLCHSGHLPCHLLHCTPMLAALEPWAGTALALVLSAQCHQELPAPSPASLSAWVTSSGLLEPLSFGGL